MNTATTTPTGAAPDAWADALIASFERAGYARVAPAILQPAEPFLDLSGEDIRKRMYLTTDPRGRELCLRPDLTIPVSCDYLASQGRQAGGLLLSRPGVPPSRRRRRRIPAGRHRIVRPPRHRAADAEMLALGLDATTHYGLAQPDIRMGDVALFSALVAALDLAPAWKRRLIKDFNHKTSLAQDLDRLTIGAARTGRNIRACWRRLPAPTRRPPTRWSPISSRSPASPRSAAARSARSPTASSSSRRSARRPRCRRRRAR